MEPGPDMIHAWWLKKQTSLHEHMTTRMNQLIMEELHPEFVTKGDIVLILKYPEKGAVPSNHRPITSLCTAWEFESGIIADHSSKHG